ncbi:MAG: hypothetical protein ACOZJX_14715 [Pseudomonadota bacterium]
MSPALLLPEMAVWAPEEQAAALAEPERLLARLDRQGLWLSGVIASLALLAAAALAWWPLP